MKKTLRRCCLLLVALPALATAQAEHPVARAQDLLQRANAAYQAGDAAEFTETLEQALALNPASLVTVYNLACGYARTNRIDEALELLDRLVTARVDFGMAQDPDLASLRDHPRFRSMLDRLETGTVPVGSSSRLHTVRQLGFLPEGIALDADTGRLFFGSMRSGDIYVIDRLGQLSRFASVGTVGPYGAIGMTVDPARRILWVVGTSFAMAEGFNPEDPAPAGLFGFGLASGQLAASYFVPADAGGLNDVAVAPGGDVFVSGNELHVLRRGADSLQPLATRPAAFGANGITVSPDGSTLYLSAYPVGVGAVDLASGELRFFDAPAEFPLYGIDGLYWDDGSLIGIQNGIRPWRMLRLQLDDDGSAIESVALIEFANPELTPTTGAIAGHSIIYIGQGPPPPEPPPHFPAHLRPSLGETVIMSAPLPVD